LRFPQPHYGTYYRTCCYTSHQWTAKEAFADELFYEANTIIQNTLKPANFVQQALGALGLTTAAGTYAVGESWLITAARGGLFTLTAAAIGKMFLSTTGDGGIPLAELFLGEVLMVEGDGDDTELQPVVQPGLADFAGMPGPEDPCHDPIKKYFPQYKQNLSMTSEQLRDSIKSFEKNIQQHIDKIANPYSIYPDYDSFRPGHRQHIMKKWNQDLQRNRDYRTIAECVLNTRE
jgi:hypothetical protein